MRASDWVGILLITAVGHGAVMAKTPAIPTNPLVDVQQAVTKAVAAGKTPVVIFDLDDTLFRVSYRTKKVLENWAAQSNLDAATRANITAMDPESMPYELNDTFNMAKISDPALRASAKKAWLKGFFSDTYLDEDKPLAGAVDYVNGLKKSGASIAYLTGRSAKTMINGTNAALKKAGFPVDEKARAFLKENPDINDVEFKRQALDEIRKMGTIVSGMDNDPDNTNLLHEKLPGAIVIFLDTVHSATASPLANGIPKVKDFSLMPAAPSPKEDHRGQLDKNMVPDMNGINRTPGTPARI